MRIHIIGINYRPEQTGIAVFTTGRAEFLTSRGHDVTMCTTPPYYPHWRVGAGYRRFWFGRERIAEVDVLRCPLYVPTRVTPLRRVLHEASFAITAFIGSLGSRRPDVLVVVSPPLALGVVAAMLAFLWRVPYLFDVQDLQPDAALDLGMVAPGRIAAVLFAVERLAYRHAARVSTITAALRARIVAKGVSGDRVTHLPLWAEPELFDLSARTDDAALRHALGLDETFIVLHVGNMGVKQGLDVVLDAAAQPGAAADVRYVLVGDGAARARLEADARARGLSRVRFVPLLPRAEFVRLLATSDVCLVTQQRTVADIVFPSKMLTLLAAAKPIVASVAAGSEVARVATAAGAAIVVEPEDPVALAEAVAALAADPDRRARLAASGRRYARTEWDRDASLAALDALLDEVRGAGRGANTVGASRGDAAR